MSVKIIKERLALLAMLTALTVVLALTFIFPVPMTKGYVNLLEVGIYTAAMLLGGPAGAIVGSVSGGMLDLILGYPQWIIFSVVIHGFQGYTAGRWSSSKKMTTRIFFLVIASIVMIIGYFFATSFLYGQVAGLASIIGNIIQNGFGIIVSMIIINILDRLKLIK
ncbi:ECF transporter S component [Vagococcus carniphilus]|uniref:ECF transporter S component n=1 Tax=Vagococcus carniphilus TaxID=218144 RepID=UPI003B5C096F